MTSAPLKWGILSAGKICYDFCVALTTLPKDQHSVVHVGARDINRAKEFAAKFDILKFSGSYEELLKDTNVDVVYVGTVNSTHKELCLLALQNGKHVLCEKPVTMNSKELQEVVNCAKERKLFFMEAMWTRCFPLYDSIKTKLTDGTLGEPEVLFATFGIKDLFKVERVWRKELGASVVMDVGIYLLMVADFFFGGYALKELKACGHVDEETGVDRIVGIMMTYEGNRTVQLLADGDHELPNDATLLCSKGQVKIESPFHCPEKYTENLGDGDKVQVFELPKADMKTCFTNSVGLRFEAEHVKECLSKGLLESPLVSLETSQRIMGYLDDIRRQLGSTFALDS